MSDTGVVDPIRIPTWIREPAERWWRETPPLARAFIGLAVLDILGRAIGILAPRIDWAYMTPLAYVTAFLPHDAWIVLPALLILRRPDAARATPWIFWGAIVVAVVELARDPAAALFADSGGAPSTASVLVGTAGNVGLLAAWVLMARGLAVLTSRDPDETVVIVANLAAASVGLLAALDFAQILLSTGIDLGNPALSQAMAISWLASSIQLLGWAYLLWVVIRGIGDRRRPPIATGMAAAGAMLAAFVVLVVDLAARLLGAIGHDFGGGSGFNEVYGIVSWLGYVLGPSLIAIAFALGLADPPVPYQAPAPQPPEPPAPAAPRTGTADESGVEEPAILPE